MELVDGVAKAIKRFMNDRATRIAAEKEAAEAAEIAAAEVTPEPGDSPAPTESSSGTA
jgi:hypothetical protein